MKNLIYKNIIRTLYSCKKSSSIYEFKPIVEKEYIKREIIIKNNKKIISVPKNISKELYEILKKLL